MLTGMTEEDWAIALRVFEMCLSRRGEKGHDNRKFLAAIHYFTVHNITWRALPAEFGNWNSVWKRFWRLSYLERGGALTDVRIVEGEEGTWTLWVRLKGRSGEFRINQFASDQAKTYKDVARAVETCRRDFLYGGPITLVTDKVASGPDGPAVIKL